MNLQQNSRLTKQAVNLFTLGLKMERRREALRRLVVNKVPYDSVEMWEGLRLFQEAEREWLELEQRHLKLRESLMERRCGA